MKIAILGATGCIGTHLIEKLTQTDHEVVAFYRSRKGSEAKNVTWVKYDLESDVDLSQHLNGLDVVYYLVHSLDKRKFKDEERSFAQKVNTACRKADCSKIIYLGGIVKSQDELSDHLESRKVTGEELAADGFNVLEYRASIVLATCSDSFIISTKLSKRLPIMVVPKWLKSYCSPIYIDDLVDALINGSQLDLSGHKIINIGSDTMEYGQLLELMGRKQNGRKPYVITTPFVALKFSYLWIWLISRVDMDTCRHLAESLVHDTSTGEKRLREIIGRQPLSVSEALDNLYK